MKMWAEYLKEREGKEIVETAKGFAVYKLNSDKTCYIEHIYVRPKFRAKKVASELCDKIAAKVKQRGCYMLLGSVQVGAPGDTHSMKVQLAHGFQLERIEGNMVVLSKEI